MYFILSLSLSVYMTSKWIPVSERYSCATGYLTSQQEFRCYPALNHTKTWPYPVRFKKTEKYISRFISRHYHCICLKQRRKITSNLNHDNWCFSGDWKYVSSECNSNGLFLCAKLVRIRIRIQPSSLEATLTQSKSLLLSYSKCESTRHAGSVEVN